MTELERRTEALLGALATDESTAARPHVEAIATLGAQAEPFFLALLNSPLPRAELNAFVGLQRLGALVSDAGAAVIEAHVVKALPGECAWSGFALEAVRPERFWALRAHTRLAVELVMSQRLPKGAAAEFLDRLGSSNEEDALCVALGKVQRLSRGDRVLMDSVRRVLLSPLPKARAMALSLLTPHPDGAPAEALIEAMAMSAPFRPLLERVAWHPDSTQLYENALRNENLGELHVLLQRRRCAGLSNSSREVLAFLTSVLRTPSRHGAYRKNDVIGLAQCLGELLDAASLALLVEAAAQEDVGVEALTEALRSFGNAALHALEAHAASSADPQVSRRVRVHLEALAAPPPPSLQLGDQAFIEGKIDRPEGGAFQRYAAALRAEPSGHAAFQLAWIDRAFGVPISDDRARWVRSLGFRDEGLLEQLRVPARGLFGARREWQQCHRAHVQEAVDAGLPGLAFTGSKDLHHRAEAEDHVALVRLASTTS